MTARMLAVWCPGWPFVAAGVPPDAPAAVVHANRVVIASRAAAEAGVRAGLRRREAQSRCPDVILVPADPGRDARAFEPVARALDAIAPRLEIARPGACVMPAAGPARYFGGEEALRAEAERCMAEALDGRGERPRAGIASGHFAAGLAARRRVVVADDDTKAFLEPWPIATIGDDELAGLLVRLGIRTLGDFAALPAEKVVARFGVRGERAHRAARGDDHRLPLLRDPPPELTVVQEIDPPAETVDAATFAGKAAADELVERLTALGMACTSIRIEAATEYGEALERVWTYTAAFTPQALTERVRWQIEGWIANVRADAPTGGITLVRLVPQEVAPDNGLVAGLWGRPGPPDRIRRALHRVQGLLGHEGVLTPVASGGRSPAEHVHLVAWGDPVAPNRPGLPGDATVQGPVCVELPPWPGRIPAPDPAVVGRRRAEVADESGRPVTVGGRMALSAPPARVRVNGRWAGVTQWAGPWPADERWWDPRAHRRRARLQVVLDDGTAHLLAVEAGEWSAEATYD